MFIIPTIVLILVTTVCKYWLINFLLVVWYLTVDIQIAIRNCKKTRAKKNHTNSTHQLCFNFFDAAPFNYPLSRLCHYLRLSLLPLFHPALTLIVDYAFVCYLAYHPGIKKEIIIEGLCFFFAIMLQLPFIIFFFSWVSLEELISFYFLL